MNLFVYGTLKKGGKNHFFLKESRFIRYAILEGYSLYDINHGFPLMFEDPEGKVYGEIYEIDSDTLSSIDALEGEGRFYERVNDSKLDYSFYVTLDKDKFNENYYKLHKIKNGFWKEDVIYIEREPYSLGSWKPERFISNRKYNVIIDGREYSDTADKLVFHMRFFDGKRAPTNRIYMDLVKRRSHLSLNTENEEIFIIDCIIRGVVNEIRK